MILKWHVYNFQMLRHESENEIKETENVGKTADRSLEDCAIFLHIKVFFLKRQGSTI